MRQALAGMLWTKQHYHFDLDVWLREHSAHPLRSPTRFDVRNQQWSHMVNDDVISMPDKWEYPWYAAWDLAFHTVPLAMVDPEFAREQLALMLSSTYLHPSGQIPAYEWNFSDVNPPVHAAALALVYGLGLGNGRWAGEPAGPELTKGELAFLAEAFNMLLVNFTWWVNRKDPSGKNLFQGGFLGLDNIGVFDRSAQLPGGGTLEQSDGTAWMAFFSQSMLELALALAEHDPAYEGFVVKFVQHWFQIASAMDPLGDNADEMWDEEDGFFYDVLRMPDGTGRRIKVRTLVGLLPLCATAVLPAKALARFPRVSEQLRDYYARNADLLGGTADPVAPGVDGSHLLALVDERKLRRILERMLDEDRFLGPHGIRSVSKWHEDHPYTHRRRGPGLQRRVRTGRVAQRHVRRQLQLAWPGVVPHQPAARPGTAAVPPVLRRRLPDRVPDGLRPRDEPVRGGRGAGPQARHDVHPRRSRTTSGVRRCRAVPGGPDLGGQPAVLRVLPRRQRRRDRRLPPDRLDRRGRPHHRSSSPTRSGPSSQRGPGDSGAPSPLDGGLIPRG